MRVRRRGAEETRICIALGLLISLQPPFYPSEAEKMGATPAEYGFVFGIANLSLFLFSPIFGAYATRIGPKTCFNCGAVLQGVSGFLFAFLPYCTTTGLFIGLSYLLRFLEGLGKLFSQKRLDGVYVNFDRFIRFSSDFSMTNSFGFPISLKKHLLKC